jgi:hypothetical protein
VGRALTGTGTQQALLVIQQYSGPPQVGQSQNASDFGTWGYATIRQFYVHNVGGSSASTMGDGGTLNSGFALAGGFPGNDGQGAPGSCGAVLAKGSSCTVNVTYTPAGNGLQSSVLTVNYNDSLASQLATYDVSATATTRANLVVTDFGLGGCGDPCGPSGLGSQSVGQSSSAQQYTVYNTGALPATPLTFASVAPNFSISMNQCTAPLASQASCTLNLTFTPTTTGDLNSALNITYGDSTGGGNLFANRNVVGTGF